MACSSEPPRPDGHPSRGGELEPPRPLVPDAALPPTSLQGSAFVPDAALPPESMRASDSPPRPLFPTRLYHLHPCRRLEGARQGGGAPGTVEDSGSSAHSSPHLQVETGPPQSEDWRLRASAPCLAHHKKTRPGPGLKGFWQRAEWLSRHPKTRPAGAAGW